MKIKMGDTVVAALSIAATPHVNLGTRGEVMWVCSAFADEMEPTLFVQFARHPFEVACQPWEVALVGGGEAVEAADADGLRMAVLALLGTRYKALCKPVAVNDAVARNVAMAELRAVIATVAGWKIEPAIAIKPAGGAA